jgi:hypothetical protein
MRHRGCCDHRLTFAERAVRDAEMVGLTPFEFFVEGMAHFKEIGAGPCTFLIHAPGCSLDAGYWGGWPKWLDEMARQLPRSEVFEWTTSEWSLR